jgi:hypothetical protein
MSGPNARYALPADERPPDLSAPPLAQSEVREPSQPGGANLVDAAPTSGPDWAVGLALPLEAIRAQRAEAIRALNDILDQWGLAEHDQDAALIEHKLAILNSALQRTQALAGRAIKLVAALTALQQRKRREAA